MTRRPVKPHSDYNLTCEVITVPLFRFVALFFLKIRGQNFDK